MRVLAWGLVSCQTISRAWRQTARCLNLAAGALRLCPRYLHCQLPTILNRQLPTLSRTQVLHVEQEVAGDDTPVIQAVLECDIERAALLEEEAELMAALNITVGLF